MTQKDLEPLKEYIAEVIAVIIEEKESREQVPTDASIIEIQNMVNNDIKAVLNELVKQGVLMFHKTINDVSFEFKPPK